MQSPILEKDTKRLAALDVDDMDDMDADLFSSFGRKKRPNTSRKDSEENLVKPAIQKPPVQKPPMQKTPVQKTPVLRGKSEQQNKIPLPSPKAGRSVSLQPNKMDDKKRDEGYSTA